MQANPQLNMLISIIMVFAIFYFLMIRPQNIERKKLQKQLDALKKGDEVITTGGLHGTVANVRGTLVDIKVYEEVKLVFSKSAIAYVKKPQDLELEKKEANKVEVIK